MDDALAIIGYWVGLVKSAGLSISEVRRDCNERAAAGVVQSADDFRDAVDAVLETLGALQASLEEQAVGLEAELDDDED